MLLFYFNCVTIVLICIFVGNNKILFMYKRKDGFTGQRALILPSNIVQEMESDPVLSTLHVTDIGYYPKAKFHFRERGVPIMQYVLIYCVDGKGWCKIGNEEYTVDKNHYFIIPKGVEHSYGADTDDPWTIYWIHFKGKLAGQYADIPLKPSEIKPSMYSRISDRIALFEEIFISLEMGYGKDTLLYVSSLLFHFFATFRCLQQYRSAAGDDVERKDFVGAAIHFMKENMEKKISLDDISSHVGYSPSHFATLFHKQTGYSPVNYLNHLKIQQACHLLDFTSMKINQICYKIGIDDSYYFSRLFTKTMGISPREYRKQKKG